MRIEADWFVCDDGVPRPTIVAYTVAADGSSIRERFLIDSGADCTVLSAAFLGRLGVPVTSALGGATLAGVGGMQAYVRVKVTLEFKRIGGVGARVGGDFAAFTDPTATDMSILGRDVLNNFDVILSRPRSEILLLAAPHYYRVEST